MRSRAQASGSGRRCARRGGRGLVRAEPLQGGACAGDLGEARARGAWRQAERGRGGEVGGGRARARRARQRREEGERRGKERKERKKKKMGKRKEKEKGGEREGKKERGREGSAPGSRRRSRSLSATRGVRARENATHGSRNRVSDTGVGTLGNREIWRNREDSGNWG